MKNNPRLILFLITLLTIVAGVLVLPPTQPVKITTPKLPGLNRQFTLTLPLYGSTVDVSWGNNHFVKQFPFRKGLDLAGGTSVTMKADMSKISPDNRDSALAGAKTVIENRVNLYGVSEPLVQTSKVNNDYRLIVDLPGVSTEQALSLIGTTAQLSFWEAVASGSADAYPVEALPLGILQTIGPYAHPTSLSGKDLQNTTVTFDANTGAPQVQLQFTPDGTKKFADITGRNVGKIVAIVLDNMVVEAPRVQQIIPNGDAVISGSMTTDTANQLKIELQAGQLPIPLSILQQQTIGATLGASSLSKSLFAGFVGFVIIALFMMVLYGRLGIIASMALVVYVILTLCVFKLIPVTLTLAGIAGFILSVGMAVDANILIFERMREEHRSGKSFDKALTLGFARAWTSIRDSNLSTLITCFVLYQFGTGIVRGFAFTLAIGVAISLFSAIVVTRTLIRTMMGEHI